MRVSRQCAQLNLIDVLSAPVWSLKRRHTIDMHHLHILPLSLTVQALTVLSMRVACLAAFVVHLDLHVLLCCLVLCEVETADVSRRTLNLQTHHRV
jgi:low temperature requirement protein LtrA